MLLETSRALPLPTAPLNTVNTDACVYFFVVRTHKGNIAVGFLSSSVP